MSSTENFPIKLTNPILVNGEKICEIRNADELNSIQKLIIEENEKTLEESKILLEELEAEGKKQDMVIDMLEKAASSLAKQYGVE